MPNTSPIQGADTLDQGRVRMNDHFAGVDPHDQYNTQARGDARYVQSANHTKGLHDTLNINAATLGGTAASGFTPIAHTTDADPHTQYNNNTRGDARYIQTTNHTKALHDSLLIDAATLGGIGPNGYRKNSITDARDANVVTALAATDNRTQRFTVALTANRTISLPTTGMHTGQHFRINRTDTAAFTLAIGTLFTFASGVSGWLDIDYTGTAWVMTARGPL